MFPSWKKEVNTCVSVGVYSHFVYRTNEPTKLTLLLTNHLLVEAHLHQIFTDLEVHFCSPAHGQTSKCFFWSPGHAVAKYSQVNNNKTLGNGPNCNYADLLDCLLEERYEKTSLIADLEQSLMIEVYFFVLMQGTRKVCGWDSKLQPKVS